MMGSNSRKFAALTLITAFLAGCGGGIGDLQDFVQETRAQPPGRIEPIPEFQPYQNFEYASQDLRDPFRLVDFRRPDELPTEIVEGDGLRPDLDRPREPLEDFPLDTLRLKGTIDDVNGTKWGLIFAPDNTIHRVIEGNYLGQNHGRIITLTDQVIELTEIVPDGLGNYIERSSAIALIE